MAGNCHYHHANHNHHHHSNDHDHHLHACKNNCDVFYGRQSLSPQYLANHGHRHRDNHHDRHLHAAVLSFVPGRTSLRRWRSTSQDQVKRLKKLSVMILGNHIKESTNQLQKITLMIISDNWLLISDDQLVSLLCSTGTEELGSRPCSASQLFNLSRWCSSCLFILFCCWDCACCW